MGASGSTLRFSVEVSADEAQKTLKAMSLAFNEAGTQARIAMSNVKPAADEAAKATDGLFGKLKDLRGETRQHERVFAFYGQRVADATGLTKGLGTEITALGISLGSGMWLAGAVAGLKLIADEFERQHEWATKIKEINAEIATDGAAGWKRIHEAMVPVTTEEKAYRAELEQHKKTIDDVKKELDDYSSGFKGLAYWYNLNTEWVDGLTKRTEALARAQEQARNQADQMAAIAQEQTKAAAGSEGDKLIAKDQAAAREVDFKRRTLTLSTEVAKLEADAAHARIGMLPQEEAATRRIYEERLRIARIREQFSTTTPTEDNGQNLKDSLSDLDAKKKHEDFVKQLEEAKKKKEEEARAFEKAEKDKERAADQFAAVAARDLTEVITGQKSLKQVMQDIEKSILQTLLQAAIKSITISAFKTGAKAAESQADVPIIGPALAASAMGAMIAMVLGLKGSLPSGRQGWANTGSYEGLMYIHQREAVLDEQTAEDWRQSRRGGGNAPLIGTVVATNAASFGRELQDANSDLVKALRIAERRRRTRT